MNEDDIDVLDAEIGELDDKIDAIKSSKDITDTQRAELASLQGDKKSRLTKRTTVLLGRTKAAEDRARKAEERADRLAEDFKNAKADIDKRLPASKGERAKITFDGEDFFTDASLQAMVRDGDMTESDAWDHQEQRRVAAAAERISKKSEKQTFEKTRQATIKEVLDEHPQLNPAHPKYDMKDPMTAEVDRLLRNGYQFQPDGLKRAVEDAKRYLRLDTKRPDLSDQFSVTGSEGNPDRSSRGEKKVEMSEWEQDNAVRMYVNSGMTNPKTGKAYTRQEAIDRGLAAKKNRMAETAAR